MKLANYYHPTPKHLRKIGDAILFGSTSLSGMVMGAPFAENYKMYAMFGLNVLGVLGKVITNMFKEEDVTPSN